MNKKLRSVGFTLIELSIVLVIIGLLIGGVLVGRDLIDASKIRGVMTERDELVTAINTFRLKYNCIPGDCINATTFFNGVTNGNGNKVYDSGETFRTWHHMLEAGLIQGGFDDNYSAANEAPGEEGPATLYANNGGWHIYTSGVTGNHAATGGTPVHGLVGNVLALGGTDTNAAFVFMDGLLTVLHARNIDTKIDDGQPSSGKVVATRPYIQATTTWTAVCVDGIFTAAPGSLNWDTSDNGKVCRMLFFY